MVTRKTRVIKEEGAASGIKKKLHARESLRLDDTFNLWKTEVEVWDWEAPAAATDSLLIVLILVCASAFQSIYLKTDDIIWSSSSPPSSY